MLEVALHNQGKSPNDYGTTTAVNLVWEGAKKKLTPKIVVGTLSVLVVSIGFVLNLQHSSSNMKDTTDRLQLQFNELKQKLDDAAKDRADDRAKLAGIDQSVKDIANEINEQRRWR